MATVDPRPSLKWLVELGLHCHSHLRVAFPTHPKVQRYQEQVVNDLPPNDWPQNPFWVSIVQHSRFLLSLPSVLQEELDLIQHQRDLRLAIVKASDSDSKTNVPMKFRWYVHKLDWPARPKHIQLQLHRLPKTSAKIWWLLLLQQQLHLVQQDDVGMLMQVVLLKANLDWRETRDDRMATSAPKGHVIEVLKLWMDF